MPFKIITFGEFRKIKLSELKPKPKIIFVNRRKMFKPYSEVLKEYKDLLRRLGSKPYAKDSALNGSHYDMMYRRRIINDKNSLRELRKLCEITRVKDVYMVIDKDRPDAEILINICNIYMGNNIW